MSVTLGVPFEELPVVGCAGTVASLNTSLHRVQLCFTDYTTTLAPYWFDAPTSTFSSFDVGPCGSRCSGSPTMNRRSAPVLPLFVAFKVSRYTSHNATATSNRSHLLQSNVLSGTRDLPPCFDLRAPPERNPHHVVCAIQQTVALHCPSLGFLGSSTTSPRSATYTRFSSPCCAAFSPFLTTSRLFSELWLAPLFHDAAVLELQ